VLASASLPSKRYELIIQTCMRRQNPTLARLVLEGPHVYDQTLPLG